MAATYFNTTGKRIRLLRQDIGLSQTGLAQSLRKMGIDISHQYISELERTNKVPSGEVLSGLARVLGTTADYLLLLTEVPDTDGDVQADQDNRIVYEVPSEATRQLAQRLLTVFSELTDAERAYVVSIADQLRTLNHPRIIGDDTTTEGRTTEA